jgi:hypothetical protein
MRANLVPGLILQSFALAIVLAYGQSAGFHSALDRVGLLKHELGYIFSMLSTATFGGVIPFFILLASGKVPRGQGRKQFAFLVAFWAWKGVEVDAFYRAQAVIFGDGSSTQVVAAKTLVDQFVYNPLWAAPTQTVFFLWKDSEFSFAKLLPQVRNSAGFGPFWSKVTTVLFSTWVVWIPAVSIVYSLPSALQLPLSNLVLCFWCLLLTFVSTGSMQGRSASQVVS